MRALPRQGLLYSQTKGLQATQSSNSQQHIGAPETFFIQAQICSNPHPSTTSGHSLIPTSPCVAPILPAPAPPLARNTPPAGSSSAQGLRAPKDVSVSEFAHQWLRGPSSQALLVQEERELLASLLVGPSLGQEMRRSEKRVLPGAAGEGGSEGREGADLGLFVGL